MSPRALLAVAAVAVFLAGCAGGPAPFDVGMVGVHFAPEDVQVHVGHKVVWRNNGSLAHTVTSNTGLFDSGQMLPDSTYAHEFDKAGVFPYRCLPHAFRGPDGNWTGMIGNVTVLP